MTEHSAGITQESGPRRSRDEAQCPPGKHSLEPTGKELRR